MYVSVQVSSETIVLKDLAVTVMISNAAPLKD
jgi:hypothetical protein